MVMIRTDVKFFIELFGSIFIWLELSFLTYFYCLCFELSERIQSILSIHLSLASTRNSVA